MDKYKTPGGSLDRATWVRFRLGSFLHVFHRVKPNKRQLESYFPLCAFLQTLQCPSRETSSCNRHQRARGRERIQLQGLSSRDSVEATAHVITLSRSRKHRLVRGGRFLSSCSWLARKLGWRGIGLGTRLTGKAGVAHVSCQSNCQTTKALDPDSVLERSPVFSAQSPSTVPELEMQPTTSKRAVSPGAIITRGHARVKTHSHMYTHAHARTHTHTHTKHMQTRTQYKHTNG